MGSKGWRIDLKPLYANLLLYWYVHLARRQKAVRAVTTRQDGASVGMHQDGKTSDRRARTALVSGAPRMVKHPAEAPLNLRSCKQLFYRKL